MKPRNLAIISILTLVWSTSSFVTARSAISNEPLGVEAGMRALGMESTLEISGVANDRFYWNSSSIGLLNGVKVSLVGLPFAAQATDRKGAFSVGLNPQQLGMSSRQVGNISLTSRFDGWDENAKRNRILIFGYGYSFRRAITAGGNIRYHRRSDHVNTFLGWSYDLGIQLSRKLARLGDEIAFGLSVEYLGGILRSRAKLIQKLPTVVRFGTAFCLDSTTMFYGDFALHNDDELNWADRFRAHLVAEKWLFNRQFGIRLGYKAVTNNEYFIEGEWSRGFSLRNDTARLDYAYVSSGKSDEDLHWIAMTLSWNGKSNAESMLPRQQPFPILMPDLPSYSSDITNRIGQVGETAIEFRVSEGAISPNRDGVKDNTEFAFNIPTGMTWQLEICDESGERIQHNSGTGLSTGFLTWKGRNEEGNLVNDGAYIAKFTGYNSQRNSCFHHEEVIQVDTIPANLKIHVDSLLLVSASEESGRASSNGLLATSVPTVHVQVSDSDHILKWDLKILERGGNVIDRLEGNDTPPNIIVWNKWSNHQWFVDPGTDYDCVMTVYDSAGNRTARNVPLPLIELLPSEFVVVEKRLEKKGIFTEPVFLQEPDVAAPKSKQSTVKLTLPGIVFDLESYEVRSEFQSALEEVAVAILTHPEARVTIEGHTDSEGKTDYNLELSYQRSEAVKNYLVSKFGIPPERLETVGYGEERPVVGNDVESNRQKNRRVEVLLSPIANPSGTDTMTDEVEFKGSPSKEMSLSYVMDSVSIEAEVMPTWTLLLGSFKHRENAELLVENLETLNITEDIQFSEVIIESKTWYRVTVGHFYERSDAVELTHRFRDSQGIDSLLILAN